MTIITCPLSLVRVHLLALSNGSSLLSTRARVRVDSWLCWKRPDLYRSLLAVDIATLAGRHHHDQHLPNYNVSIERTSSLSRANVTLSHRHLCSSCGCLTGRDTNDDDDDHNADIHLNRDFSRANSTWPRYKTFRATSLESTPRTTQRLPGSKRVYRVESTEFHKNLTLVDSLSHATRKQRRPPRGHQRQQQQQFLRDLLEDHSGLDCEYLIQHQRQLRQNQQPSGSDDGAQVSGYLRKVPADRYITSNRNLVMVKPDPERRSVVHIVKSPSTRSQRSQSPRPVATVIDEEQLHRRLVQSKSERGGAQSASEAQQYQSDQEQLQQQAQHQQQAGTQTRSSSGKSHVQRDRDRSVSSSSSSGSKSDSLGLPLLNRSRAGADNEPPPAAIIIPPSVARSLSMRRQQPSISGNSEAGRLAARDLPTSAGGVGPRSPDSQGSGAITREQLEYGPLLRPNEVQVLYRSPETFAGSGSSSLGLGSISSVSSTTDRQTRDDQNKQVAPHMRQSPIAFMSMNPAYEVHQRPLYLEYPATVENLRMNNTGFCWEVKIPYQLSASTSLSGAHLASTQRFRLDQFHCHWGDSCDQGSEHTIDNRHYSAEMHFVHYNMEKYHTMSKAARHPDGLVVVGVLIDAQPNYHNHAELEKVVSNLKSIQLKGEHSYIKQVLRIDNLLPANRSYWSYQGSLTTPPYLESVTWFVLKQPIKCNTAQIERFRNIKSTIRHDDDDRSGYIRSNCRKTQPLNGRTIVTYDEPAGGARS